MEGIEGKHIFLLNHATLFGLLFDLWNTLRHFVSMPVLAYNSLFEYPSRILSGKTHNLSLQTNNFLVGNSLVIKTYFETRKFGTRDGTKSKKNFRGGTRRDNTLKKFGTGHNGKSRHGTGQGHKKSPNPKKSSFDGGLNLHFIIWISISYPVGHYTQCFPSGE